MTVDRGVHPGFSDDHVLRDLLQSGYRYALTLTRDEPQAEDVLHEACLSLSRSGGTWERRLLFRAIKHRYIDAYRRDQRRPDEVGVEPGVLAAVAGSGAQDGVLAKLVQADTVRDALHSLSDDEREAVYLAWVEGYTARETARQLDRPRGTILSLLHRARQKLRDRLEPGSLRKKAQR
ncbi:MAG: RNA polymerase sigma factor [Planctomycetota bacterium]